ncbi:gag-pol polyprotein [Tanacetum coccineum]
MLVQPTEYEGEASERQSEPQPTPSPPHLSADQYKTQPDPSPRPSPTIPIPNSIPEGSGGNHRGQSSSDRSLLGNADGLTLQSVYDLCVSLCKQVTDQAKEIKHLKAHIKKLKQKNLFDLDDIVDDAMDYMESEDAQDDGRTSSVVLEEKKSTQKGVSTEVEVSTIKLDEGTDKSKVSTDKLEVSTAKPKEVEVSTDKLDEGTAEPKDGTSDESTAPTTCFRDDEEHYRPRATSTRSVLTLKPLPKINPKDKGKKVLEEEVESDVESEGVECSNRSFDSMLRQNKSPERSRGLGTAEEEKKKLARKKLSRLSYTSFFFFLIFDDIQARIEADRLLVARLQEEERETFTVKERAKFFYDTIVAQRRFLAQQRAAAIRSRPPIRTQLRNQMMTYLKHVGGKKHADLKNKNFEEIQVLYKKVKREEDTAKVPAEQEVTEQGTKKRKSGHMKMIARKRPRPQQDDDSDDEHRKYGDYLVVYRVNGHFRAFNYLMEVLHIFDRQDLFHLYDLVMKRYSEITPECIELILWGDLKIMMESSTEENNQGIGEMQGSNYLEDVGHQGDKSVILHTQDLNGGFFQILIALEDQDKMTFTFPYGTFAYRRMPFGLCNVPITFQRCMTVIFHDMVEDFMEVFMDDFLVFGNSFDCCLANLDRMRAWCEETNLVLNWEKYHFMVKEGIVLGHKISEAGIECMTRSSTKELFTPFKDPEREFQSSRKHFKTLGPDESRSPYFDIFSDQEEYSEEEVAKTMAETMEQYMSKTRADYGSGIARPKIEDKDSFELKGQFLKELRDNTFSGSDHEDANEHIEKVLEIMDLFHIPNITIDQVMLRAFSMPLTGSASREMQEVVLFYNGLGVPTRQILDSRRAIPSKAAADAKIAIQEIAEYS